MKVLILDSDWRFKKMAVEYLESRAHLVACDTQPDEAIQRVEHWQPDLVIVDSESAEKTFMKQIYRMESRPAVLLTGWMDRFDITWRAWQYGGDELLIKPMFRQEDLHEAIVMALENAATGDRSAGGATAISA